MRQTHRLFAIFLVLCLLLTNGGMALAEPAPADAEEKVLTLPASLKSIEEEAFYGDDSLGEVILPAGIERIGARAFAQSSVKAIYLPGSLTAIDESAFAEVEGLHVSAEPDSYAYDWALAHGYISDPIASVTVAAFSRFIFDRDEMDGYWTEENGFVARRWSRVNCWPRDAVVTITFRDDAHAPISGPLNDIIDDFQQEFENVSMHWESDETWDNPWDVGEHTIRFYVGSASTTCTVTVLANPVTSISVPDVTRYLGGRTQGVYGYINDAGEQVDAYFERLDANPADERMTVVAGGKTYTGDLGEIKAQLKADFGMDFSRYCHWESDDTPEHPWSEPDDYTAWQYIGDVRGEYTVHVRENPIASVSVGAIERYVTDRDEVYGYADENGEWVNAPWQRLSCWPWDAQVEISFTDGRAPLSGRFSDFYESLSREFEIYTQTDESYQNPWGVGDHTASLFIEGVEATYTVYVLADPVESVALSGGVTRYEFERSENNGWVDAEGNYYAGDWSSINVYPRWRDTLTLTVTLDGVTYSGKASEVENSIYKAGYQNLAFRWDSDQTPNAPWTPREQPYQATLTLGAFTVSYPVKVLADPVESLTIDPTHNSIERYSFDLDDRWGYELPNGDWFDGPWQSLNAWPGDDESLLVTAVVDGVTYSGTANQVVAAMRAGGYSDQVCLSWENDETGVNRWETGKTYTGTLTLGGKSADYAVTVKESPITGIEVCGELTCYLGGKTQRTNGYDYYNEQSGRIEHVEFDEPYDRLDVNPADLPMRAVTNEWIEDGEGGHYRTIDGENLNDLCGKLYEAYGVGFMCHWESAEGPESPWDAVGDYTAWQIIGPWAGSYTVHVIEYPIASVVISPITRCIIQRNEIWGYEDEDGDWVNESWDRVDCWPYDAEVTVRFKDGRAALSGRFDEIEGALRADFTLHWESDESPLNVWTPGEHSAQLCIGGVGWPYQVTVLENPITALRVDDVCHTIGVAASWNAGTQSWDEDNGEYPEHIDCNPNTIHATAVKNGEEIRYDGDEQGFHGWMNDNFHFDPELRYRFVNENNDFAAGGSYAVVLTLGPEDAPLMTARYQLKLIENPIKGIRIDHQTFLSSKRYESRSYKPENGFWAPCDRWMQLDVTPFIQVTLADGETLEGYAQDVFDELNAEMEQPALHYYILSPEQPSAPWYSGEHSAIFVIGTNGYYYDFSVIDNPIASVEIPDVTRAANCLSDWTSYYDYTTEEWVEYDGKPWRIEAHPESITITLADGFRFANGEQSLTFENTETRGCLGLASEALYAATGVNFTLRWNSNEIPSARWQPGDTGDAWVQIFELEDEGVFHYGVHVTEPAMRVALVTDGGDVNDGSFNEASYAAAKAFCESEELDFDWFIPYEDEDLAELVRFAADLGNTVLVLPGFSFAPVIAELASEYPDVNFIALDVTEEDMGDQLSQNVYCAGYREELAGYMAGYAAVKLGYTQLGFLGGMAVPGVVCYGYGFVQGADAAAAELNASVSIKYAYSDQFSPDEWITKAMEAWYESGTQVVFACSGGAGYSVAEAAENAGGRIIGVDVDQAGEFGADLTLTSAMKCLGVTVTAQLAAIENGSFAGGRAEKLGIVSNVPGENYVQLAPSTQFGPGFTEQDYAALVAALNSGALTVSDDTEIPVESLAHTATVSCIENLMA